MSGKVKKSQREPKGVPFVKGMGPIKLVKLREDWLKPDDLQPTVYIGQALPISRVMKFLDAQGMTGPQRQLLRKGNPVTVNFGHSGTRTMSLVSPESESGTFRITTEGLERIDQSLEDKQRAATIRSR